MAGKIIVFLFFLCLVQHFCYSKKTLYLAALLPFERGGKGDWAAVGSDIACEIAVDDINNTPTLLKDYELRIRKNASRCDRGRASYQLFEQLNNKDKIVALIAAGCSIVTQPIAEITQHVPLLQFSFLSTSPALLDRKIYPYYHQIKPNANGLNLPRVSLMKQFQWNHAVILSEDDDLFVLNAQDLSRKLTEEKINTTIHVVSKQKFGSSSADVLQKVKDSKVRIIFALLYAPTARRVVCQAYNMSMKSSTYVWIFPGWYQYHESPWFLRGEREESISCTQTQMKDAINGHLSLDLTRISAPDSMEVLPNKSFIQFKQEYSRRAAGEFTVHAAYGYDTVVAIALMMDKAANQYPDLFENVDYHNKTFVRILNDTLTNNVSFEGFTGNVTFQHSPLHVLEKEYYEKAVVQYHRYFGNSTLRSVEVGKDCNASEKHEPNCPINWTTIDGSSPVSYPRATTSYSHEAIFYVVATVDVLCIILTILLLFFTFYHRNKRIIKLSSPRLNYLIGIGAIMMYIAVILYGFDGQFFRFNDDSLHCCFARNVLYSCGFTLAFGSMFAKTWRVSVIFRNANKGSSVKLTDHVLFAIVGVFLLVDILFFSLWYGLAPYTQENIPLGTNDRGEMKLRQKCVLSAAGHRWDYILLAYKAVVLAIGAFLAFQTRSVYIKSLNDSRFIAMSIYNTVVMGLLATAFAIFIKDPGVSFALTGISVIILASVIIALVFISKVYYLWFRKNDQLADVGRLGSKSRGSLDDLTFAKKSDLKRLQKEIERQKLAMLMMISEGNLSEATKEKIKKDFELTTENPDGLAMSGSDTVTLSEL